MQAIKTVEKEVTFIKETLFTESFLKQQECSKTRRAGSSKSSSHWKELSAALSAVLSMSQRSPVQAAHYAKRQLQQMGERHSKHLPHLHHRRLQTNLDR